MPDDETQRRLPSREDVARTLPSEGELWNALIAVLAATGNVEIVAPGVVRLDQRTHPVDILATPAQWRQYVLECERHAWVDSGVDAWGP